MRYCNPTLILGAIIIAVSTTTSFSFGIHSSVGVIRNSSSGSSSSSSSRQSTKLQMMMEMCPEIPTTAQMDPKYDTCIIALG